MRSIYKFRFKKLEDDGRSDKEKSGRRSFKRIRCNICNRVFKAASTLHRFCRTCKQEDELFRFAEWLSVY